MTSYEIIPSDKHVAATASVEMITDDLSDEESITAVPRASVDADPATPVEIPRAASPAIIKPPSPSGSGVSQGSWSKGEEEKSTFQDLTTNADDSDDSVEQFDDRIANQFAELERDQVAVGLGLGDITTNGLSSVTVTNITRGPIIINHTELTPIMEAASPRESMVSEPGEPVSPPSLVDIPKDIHSSPPPTRQSQSSNRGPTSPASPAISVHSTERARTSSLTSQAERLRNKFLHRKASPERDLTVDTDAAGSEQFERRMKFEHLIRSGETMKMTLTPTSLRSIEVQPAILILADLIRMILVVVNNVRYQLVYDNKLKKIQLGSCLIFYDPPVLNHSLVEQHMRDVDHCHLLKSIDLLHKPFAACLQLPS
jgi:hypothetical protein